MPLLYFFIFASIVLGTFNIGPFSIRVYMTILMIAFLLLKYRRKKTIMYQIPISFLWLFIGYIVLTALALILNGEYEEYDFTKQFLAKFLNCIVTFFAFDYFINNQKQLRNTIVFLIVIMTFNCLVTILQYLGHPIGRAIALLLITSKEVQAEIVAGQGYNPMNVFGEDITIGIFNFTFINANYIAIVGLMLLGLWESSRNFVIKWGALFLIPLFLIASFVTQSRTPFILLFLFSLFLFIRGLGRKKAGFILIGVLIVFLIIILPIIWESVDFGRLFDSEKYENDPRQKIWEWCISFIMDHLLLGAPVLYEKLYDMPPHNYFLNAFITSGLFGGLLASYLFFKVLIDSARLFMGKHQMLVSTLAGSVLIYTAGSLFHNASMVSGDTMFFVVYCLMLKSLLMEKGLQIYKSNINN